MLATSHESICIVGVGATTPIGLNAPATAAAVSAGIAAMAFHPFMIDKIGSPMVVCASPAMPVELEVIDRFLGLALSASQEALIPLTGKTRALPEISVLLALPEERPGISEHFESIFVERFSSALAQTINIQEIICHPLGHAGGFLCMKQALSLIRSGKSQICLVGGVDSYLEPETLEWLDDIEQLHSETTIWGFCPGEGAAFCLLTSHKLAVALGLSAEIELVTAATTNEPNPIKTETVCIGQGLTEAFQKTLADLPKDCHVNLTICDMNGEPYRANEYGFAMLRTAASFTDDADFITPADCWGDVGAASGTLFAILATFAAKKEYSPGRYTLLWASSEHGLRGTALLKSIVAMKKEMS